MLARQLHFPQACLHMRLHPGQQMGSGEGEPGFFVTLSSAILGVLALAAGLAGLSPSLTTLCRDANTPFASFCGDANPIPPPCRKWRGMQKVTSLVSALTLLLLLFPACLSLLLRPCQIALGFSAQASRTKWSLG